MRLLFAAAALFVLLTGLAILTVAVLIMSKPWSTVMPLFMCFFVVGLLLFSASAFIKTDTVTLFLNSTKLFRGGAS